MNANISQDNLAETMKEMFSHVMANAPGMYEGGASPAQVGYLRNLASKAGALRIAEIGFNVGFSTIGFLESSPDVEVVSFEIDYRPSVQAAKEFIDRRYPGRHQIVLGDSRETLPDFPHGGGFDLIFVDGDHEYETSISDIRNSCRLAKRGALVVVDDLTPWYPWGTGPTRAWKTAVADGLIEPVEYVVDGEPVDIIEGPADRAWAAGVFR